MKTKISLILYFCILTISCVGDGKVRDISIQPEATRILSSNYEILGSSIGESSTFYILGFIPITTEISMDYALSQAVQKIPNGQTMVDLKVWHETRYFFPLGTVSVLKVRGNVIGKKAEAK
ncbi:MAG: hypothetical protein CK427_15135 [Leptospira sp.]|nr:MAG: hypothetical protein CK427_15135 [Leptospira sp.]